MSGNDRGGEGRLANWRMRLLPGDKRLGVHKKHCVNLGDLALSCVFETAGGAKLMVSPPAADVALRTARAMKRSRMEIVYSGHVQGVGFRYTVRTVATGFEVTGRVRNRSDGRVELVAEGLREELEAFRAAILESGLEHFIRDEQASWTEAADDFRGFEIVG